MTQANFSVERITGLLRSMHQLHNDRKPGEPESDPPNFGLSDEEKDFLSEFRNTRKGGPSATLMIRRLSSMGWNSSASVSFLQQCFSIPDLQHLWHPWTDCNDREEWKFRLEILEGVTTLHSSMVKPVTFFFRASDPAMYQIAARVVGHHAPQNADIERFITGYLNRFKIDPEKPVWLNDERSLRRILLAFAALYRIRSSGFDSRPASASGSGTTPQPDPESILATVDLTYLLTEDAEKAFESASLWDLTVYTMVLEMIKDVSTPDKWIQGSRMALKVLPARNHLEVDRIALRRWCTLALLSVETQPDTFEEISEWIIRLFTRHHQFMLEASSGNFERVLRSINALDELIRGICRMSKKNRLTLFQQLLAAHPAETGIFINIRSTVWLSRMDDNPGISTRKESGHNETGQITNTGTLKPESLQDILGIREYYDHQSILFVSDSEKVTIDWKRWLSCVVSTEKWTSFPVRKKALIAFRLIDICLYEELEGVHFEYPESEEKTIVKVLRLLVAAEPGTVNALADSRLLHDIEDPHLLFQLIKTDSNPESLAILADVLEHHFRVRVATDSLFNPFWFLYGILLRKPDPALLNHLKSICRSRTYETKSGEEIAILPFLEWLGEMMKTTTVITPENIPLQSGSFGSELQTLRQKLMDLQSTGDPGERLSLLSDLLHGPDDPGKNGHYSLATLAAHFQNEWHIPASGSLNQSTGKVTLNENLWVTAASECKRWSGELIPEALDRIDLPSEVLILAVRRIPEIRDKIPELIPLPEARLTIQVLDQLADDLQEWRSALESLHQQWLRLREDHWPDNNRRNEMLATISGLEHPEIRRGMIRVFWTSLTQLVRKKAGNEEEYREFQLELFTWAGDLSSQYDSDYNTTWHPLICSFWNSMVDASLESGYSWRLRHLADSIPGAGPENSCLNRLQKIRIHFYDCYRLFDAIRANRAMQKVRDESMWTHGRENLSFFMHYNTLWIALLVGAVLMLDFGDAWMAMAEIEDVRGIAITFLLGLGGAFLYITGDISRKSRRSPEENRLVFRMGNLFRVAVFLTGCLVYTLILTSLFWWLLSGTDEVVHGDGALLHIAVWTAFALFIGVFFGLLGKQS